jgi:hypothetical protein
MYCGFLCVHRSLTWKMSEKSHLEDECEEAYEDVLDIRSMEGRRVPQHDEGQSKARINHTHEDEEVEQIFHHLPATKMKTKSDRVMKSDGVMKSEMAYHQQRR